MLKFRQRSRKEIYDRLKKKKFDEEIINETISFLKNKGFIDDQLFAKAWIESRIKKPLGLRKIRQELNLKGIDKQIIDSQIGEIKEKYLQLYIGYRISDSIRNFCSVHFYREKLEIYILLSDNLE